MTWKYSTYSKIDSIAKEHFPFQNPREFQLETISEIIEAIEKGYKYIVLEAGTGTGKSAIAATLASIYESSYILTITKQLQDQYSKDFEDFKRVKGRNNFRCRKYAEDGADTCCDLGRCKLEKYKCEYKVNPFKISDLRKINKCHYYKQKTDAIYAKTVISNYDYLFHELNYVNDFQARKLMIFDEAHNLENKIMQLLTLEFTRKELKDGARINLSKENVNRLKKGNYRTWMGFISKINEKYKEELEKLKNVPKSKQNREFFQKQNILTTRCRDFENFINYIYEDPDNWIFDYNKKEQKGEFKPIKVDKYAKDVFLKYGEICIFMSATILDYELFGKWLGIDKEEIYAIRRESPFDIRRNPIITYSNTPMTYKFLEENAPKTIPVIEEILENHKDEKGLIHTVSKKCKSYLEKKLNNKRLISHETYNRHKKLEEFKRSDKPLVLISPSMNEGVDLPGKECRFQIIYKIPYPSLGDLQTKTRKNKDQIWYAYNTVISLLQTYGRGLRSEDDFCTTYFIDSRLKNYIKRDKIYNNFIPDYFKEAVDLPRHNLKEEITAKKEERHSPKNTEFKEESYDLKNIKGYSYYRNVQDKIKKRLDFKEEREYIKNSEDDFLEIEVDKNIIRKHQLKRKGKDLESDYPEALEFYKEIKDHELFKNDYYPYRRMCILHKKYKNPEEDLETILEFLKSNIYCNGHQLIWFENKITELKNQLNISEEYREEIDNALLNFKNKRESLKINENKPVYITERIVYDDKNNIRVVKKEKFDKIQKIYEIKEKGMGFERSENYQRAFGYYDKLSKHELPFLRYHAYNRLRIISKKVKKPDREEIEESEEDKLDKIRDFNRKFKMIHITTHDFTRLKNHERIKINETELSEKDKETVKTYDKYCESLKSDDPYTAFNNIIEEDVLRKKK